MGSARSTMERRKTTRADTQTGTRTAAPSGDYATIIAFRAFVDLYIMTWPEVATGASFHSTFPSHRTRTDTAYTPLPEHGAANRVLSFDSDITFIAVGHRITGLMLWRIIEMLGKKKVWSGPRGVRGGIVRCAGSCLTTCTRLGATGRG